MRLGDLDDVGAYVGRVVANGYRDASPSEREELVLAGIAYVAEVAAKLAAPLSAEDLGPDAPLRAAVAPQLANRIHDEWRRLHREHRRNAKTGTATTLPAPTGLAHEHLVGAAAAGLGALEDPAASIERRLAFLAINSPRDLRDPAHFLELLDGLGLPSHAPPPLADARSIFDAIDAERSTFDL